MKLYVKLLSLTLALMFVFLTGYFSGLFVSAEAATRIAAALRIAFLPPFAAFETIWSAVYITEIIILTSTFSKRILRKSVPLWICSGILDVITAYALFALNLFAFAFALSAAAVAVKLKITLFYVEKAPALSPGAAAISVWYALLCAAAFTLMI